MLHFIIFALLPLFSNGDVFDGAGNPVNYQWLETGQTILHTDKYVVTQSRSAAFKEPQVYISMMTNGGDYLYSGYDSCARIRDVTNTTTNPGRISFYAKIVQPNDSWCNYTWWTPQVMPSVSLWYMITERGHFNISGAEFDSTYRHFNTHCTGDIHRHFFYDNFGTVGIKPLYLAQMQTTNDGRFVTFRGNLLTSGANNNRRAVSYYVQLHNPDRKWNPTYGDCVSGHFDDHYDNNRWRQAYTITTEKISVFAWNPLYAGCCQSFYAFEGHSVIGITSDPRFIAYFYEYTTPPGTFGMYVSFR